MQEMITSNSIMEQFWFAAASRFGFCSTVILHWFGFVPAVGDSSGDDTGDLFACLSQLIFLTRL